MKYSRFALLLPLLVAGCNLVPSSKKSSDSTSNSDITGSTTTTTTSSSTSDEPYTQPTTTGDTTTTYDPTTTSSDDPYMDGRNILPCGYVQLDKPTNSPITITTSNDSADWYSQEFKGDFDDDYTFIYGNSSSKGPSGHYVNADNQMYAYNESKEDQYPGGIKYTKRSQGLQTPMFSHTGPKLEIRIGISQVNEANGTPEKGKPTGYLYFYNADGDFLSNKTIDILEGSIVSSTAGKYLKYYVLDAQDISYFEFRLNAQPYKGGQNYNFGIGYISIHSFPQV